MDKKTTTQDVTALIEGTINNMSIELVDVEFLKEGGNYFLRIYIDKEGGINIEDCKIVSRAIEPILDEKDPIKPAYILEVSSPGIDRVLKTEKDFIKYAGSLVDVRLYKPVDGAKKFQATFVEKQEDILILEVEGNILKIDKKDVAKIQLAIVF
ncbi:MAG: ribosome maturation factor RimP [Epulopiscium sp. Nuni2H_MBin003]|nr:MAG: ribosome maturation factor RimP [Epulopiscium sp. Nuni2H_MBin003]